MPFVNIKMVESDATHEQKAKIIEGVTRLLSEVLGKNPDTTHVLIEEFSSESWGIGGETVANRRKKMK
jgi:4-oxalocrotonate tautomerase